MKIKIWKILLFLLVIALAGLVIWLNLGRLGSTSERKDSAQNAVESYVKKEIAGKEFSCEVRLDEGYPKRYPERPSDIYSGKQEIWKYNWQCAAHDEMVDGFLVIFSDGNTVWSGKSTVRGRLPTEEY